MFVYFRRPRLSPGVVLPSLLPPWFAPHSPAGAVLQAINFFRTCRDSTSRCFAPRRCIFSIKWSAAARDFDCRSPFFYSVSLIVWVISNGDIGGNCNCAPPPPPLPSHEADAAPR